jgi:hypothetical protein
VQDPGDKAAPTVSENNINIGLACRSFQAPIYRLRVSPSLLQRMSPFVACAVKRRRFPVGVNPRRPLQPEATGAAMEVTRWLKPSDSESRYTVIARVLSLPETSSG